MRARRASPCRLRRASRTAPPASGPCPRRRVERRDARRSAAALPPASSLRRRRRCSTDASRAASDPSADACETRIAPLAGRRRARLRYRRARFPCDRSAARRAPAVAASDGVRIARATLNSTRPFASPSRPGAKARTTRHWRPGRRAVRPRWPAMRTASIVSASISPSICKGGPKTRPSFPRTRRARDGAGEFLDA